MSATMTSIVEDEIGGEATENVTLLDPGTEDAALVAAAKRGDGRAFEVLVGRHQSRIQAIASRFTRVPEDAEDVAQQSLQKAFIHLQQFDGNSAFSTWLTRITINEALMWLRKKRSAPEVPIEESAADNGDTFLPGRQLLATRVEANSIPCHEPSNACNKDSGRVAGPWRTVHK